MQTSIFDFMYPKFKIDKPIRLITLFSGYDSQALSLKHLGIPFEHYKTCEWAVKSIQALKDLHFENDTTDYSSNLTKEELIEYLTNKGISADYNKPMTKDQIKRLGETQLRNIYNNIKASHNLVNIQQVKGNDLEIVDTDKYCYICTYSFPCQDLSLAGNRQLMSDTSTRSGMLWEVERVLDECKELGNLPQVLLMENVVQVHGEGAVKDFNKWQLKLEELGYKNYWQDLIATDYEIPQTRNRCFMVSILGDYSYSFPKKKPLKLRLKDFLEDNVDEKYFLSDKMLQGMIKTNFNSYKLENRLQEAEGVIDTLTTATGARAPHCIKVIPNLKIKNATKKGYLEATEGDGIDISGRMEYHRGTVQKGKAQTINTMGGEDIGVVNKDMRIRKLTPKECFRLMGVKDEDYEKIAKNQSDSSLYHLAGDSIVVQVIMAIIKEMI